MNGWTGGVVAAVTSIFKTEDFAGKVAWCSYVCHMTCESFFSRMCLMGCGGCSCFRKWRFRRRSGRTWQITAHSLLTTTLFLHNSFLRCACVYEYISAYSYTQVCICDMTNTVHSLLTTTLFLHNSFWRWVCVCIFICVRVYEYISNIYIYVCVYIYMYI